MDEDWRLRIRFTDDEAAGRHAERVEAARLEEDVRRRLGPRLVVSRDGAELFVYAETENSARLAEQVIAADLGSDDWSADVELTRWHDDAEDWEAAGEPLPASDDDRAAERARLMEREDRDEAEQGYPDWEVRVELPTHGAARELADRLTAEEIPVTRRWRYVLVGAADEDAATSLAERLRGEAPEGAKVSVEGTAASVERNNPFAFLSAVAGGP
jgi:hypothetical protein